MRKIILISFFAFLFLGLQPRQITWVAIGDSITYLNEHVDETGNRVTSGYMTKVVKKIPDIHYSNQGHNGWTAVKMATEIENLGLTKADVYTIFLGTNDWWAGKPLGSLQDYTNNTGIQTVYGAFRIIINKIRDLNDQAKIILITPMQRVDFVYISNYQNNAYGSYREKNGQLLEQFAAAIVSIAEYEHFPVVDLFHQKGMGLSNLVKFKKLKNPKTGEYNNYPYPSFIDIPFHPDTDEYPYPVESINITYDGLHPSDKGYAIIADKLVKLFKKL